MRGDANVGRKVFDYGVGLGTMLTKHFLDRATAAGLVARLLGGSRHLLSARSPKNADRSATYPISLKAAELVGIAYAPVAYVRSAVRGQRGDARKAASNRIWIGEVELGLSLYAKSVSRPPHPTDASARLLVRLHNQLLGFVSIPLVGDELDAQVIWAAVRAQLAQPLVRHFEADGLAVPEEWPTGGVAGTDACTDELPLDLGHELISVVVCTRDRPVILATCLKLLQKLRYARVEIIVVDNAPSTEETRECFTRPRGRRREVPLRARASARSVECPQPGPR